MFSTRWIRMLAFCVLVLFASRSSLASARKVKDMTYYKVLGVSSSVKDADLKKAYRKLALQWHPDKHSQKSPEDRAAAEAKFKEISLAYDTLSDPQTRKLYDQVGEQGMKRGESGQAKGFQAHDPFKIFEQFFGGGGGGFKFSFGGGGFSFGGHEAPQGLFADSPDDVETLKETGSLKEAIAESALSDSGLVRQLVVILCIAGNSDCKAMKSTFVKLAHSHKGSIDFLAADCVRQPDLCRIVEPDVQRYPCVVYYGYKKRIPYVHSNERMSARSVRVWLADQVPDRLIYIKSAVDLDKVLDTRHGRTCVLYMTGKNAVPPRLKALSMEFEGQVDIAILSKKDVPEALTQIEATSSFKVETLPALYNVQSQNIVSISGSEYHAYFTSLVEDAQNAKLQELSLDLYESGVCNTADYRFCLLAIFRSAADLESEKKRGTLRRIAEEYSLDDADALRVVYIIRDTAPDRQPRLWNLLRQLPPDGDASGAILWRPKWRRFDTFDGDLSDADALRSFVRSTFVRAALDGDRGLRVEHTEL